MRVILLLCQFLLISAEIDPRHSGGGDKPHIKPVSRDITHVPSKIYVDDPKHEFHRGFFSNDQVVGQNTRWMERLLYHGQQMNFVEHMINIAHAIPVTPVTALNIVDESPHCWVFLVYNSDEVEKYGELKELGKGMSEFFYERCGVGMLDLAYPSNFDTFGDLVSTPGVIFKRPNTMHEMFHHDDINDDAPFFVHNPISQWGDVFHVHELESNPVQVMETMNAIYNHTTTKSQKIAAVFMDHYTNHPEDPKFFLNMLIGEVLKELHAKVYNQMVNEGLVKENVKSGTHWRDIVAKDEKLNAKIKEAMATEVANFDFEQLLNKSVREKLSEFMKTMRFEHVEGEEFDLVDAFHRPDSLHLKTTPREQKPFDQLIPKWIKMTKNEL